MAQPRKKYNPARKLAKLKELHAKNVEQRLRSAMIGARLSFNSAWEQSGELSDREYHPSGFERAMQIARDANFIGDIFLSWPFNWLIIATVYCEDSDGRLYDQSARITADGKSMNSLGGYIENVVIPELKKRCNHAHIKEWGYFCEIIDNQQ